MVQDLRSRLIQPMASSSRGLPWTWRHSYKCTWTLSMAFWSCERLLRMLCFQYYIPDLHGREMRAAVAGTWLAVWESWKFSLNSTSSIAGISLSNHLIDRWWTFCGGFDNVPVQSQYYCFAFLLSGAIVANFARYQNKLCHHRTSLAGN